MSKPASPTQDESPEIVRGIHIYRDGDGCLGDGVVNVYLNLASTDVARFLSQPRWL